MGLKRNSEAVPNSLNSSQLLESTDDALLALKSNNPAQKRHAVRILAEQPNHGELLFQLLETEQDPSVHEAVFTAFERIGGAQIVQCLIKLLRTENASLRNASIESLSKMPAEVSTIVPTLLQDSDSDVRIFTVNMLGELPHPSVATWLSDVLRNESEVNVVGAAIEVMAEIGSVSDVPLLTAVAQRFNQDPFIVFAADMARQRIETT